MQNELRCSCCDSPLGSSWQKNDSGFHICPYCRTANNFGAPSSEEPDHPDSSRIRAIYIALEQLHFDAAETQLAELRSLYPTCGELYFLSALASNCVCYTRDVADPDHWIPTLNNVAYRPLMESEFVRKAFQYSPSEIVSDAWRETIELLEGQRKEAIRMLEEVSNRFDVFISVKVCEIGEDGQPRLDGKGKPVYTSDYSLAFDIYMSIRQRYPNLRVFFSEAKEIKELMSGKKYEPIIYSALHSSKAFILVSNSRQNVEWRWVLNEWSRYLYIMRHETPNPTLPRSFVFVTDTMTDAELPLDLRGLQFIDYSHPTQAAVTLFGWLDRAIKGGKRETAQIQARSFEEGISRLDASHMEASIPNARSLAKAHIETNQDQRDEIEFLTHQIVTGKAKGFHSSVDDAYGSLERMLVNDPNLYEARRLLVFKGSTFTTLEDYVQTPENIDAHPEYLRSFLEFATQEDAVAILEMLASRLFPQGSHKSASLTPSAVSTVLDDFVIPYLSYIGKRILGQLRQGLRNHLALYQGETKESQSVVRAYFSLSRFLDGDDPQKYIDVRLEYLDKLDFAKSKSKAATDRQKKFHDSICKEILDVNPSNIQVLWRQFIVSNRGDALAEPIPDIEKAVAQVRDDKFRAFPVVKNEKNVSAFVEMLRYAPSEDKPKLVEIFLYLIIKDPQSYNRVGDNESLAPSVDDDGSGELEDRELNGYDLFCKYMGYPLEDGPCAKTIPFPTQGALVGEDGLVKTSDLYNPNPDAYRVKKTPRPIDRLFLLFAVEMHRARFFEQAQNLYEYYLGQQESPNAGDALLVRFYLELAKVRAVSGDELRYIGAFPNTHDLEKDIFIANKGVGVYEGFMETIKVYAFNQREFYNEYIDAKRILDCLPRPLNTATVSALKEAYQKLQTMIDGKTTSVQLLLRHEFRQDILQLERAIAAVEFNDSCTAFLTTKPAPVDELLCQFDRLDEVHLEIASGSASFIDQDQWSRCVNRRDQLQRIRTDIAESVQEAFFKGTDLPERLKPYMTSEEVAKANKAMQETRQRQADERRRDAMFVRDRRREKTKAIPIGVLDVVAGVAALTADVVFFVNFFYISVNRRWGTNVDWRTIVGVLLWIPAILSIFFSFKFAAHGIGVIKDEEGWQGALFETIVSSAWVVILFVVLSHLFFPYW